MMGFNKMKQNHLELVRVFYMPESLELGKIYYSEEFSTVKHLCPCGCGQKVVTPIQGEWKDGWKLNIENELITLEPSIGNFQLPCKTHYFIRNGEIIWA